MNNRLLKKQSAFSLIEVMVSLLILSLFVLGVAKMMLTSLACYQRAEHREQGVFIAWSIAEALRHQPRGASLEAYIPYWQQRLEQIFPGSTLRIQSDIVDNKCVYMIGIHFLDPTLLPLKLQVGCQDLV